MSNNLVIYHADCFDGVTAAWVVSRFGGWGDAEYHGAKYGEDPPDVRGKRVLIVDFCYPRPIMERLDADAGFLRCLDHHKTAAEECGDLDFCVFDMERSGAGLAWDHMTRDPRPWLVDVVEDRDLWRHRLNGTSEIMAWIAAQPMTFKAWDRLHAMDSRGAFNAGRHVQAYIDQYGRKARAQARWESINGYHVPTVNMPYMNCSEHVGKLLEENPEAPFAAGYFRRADGRWQFSLRSSPPGVLRPHAGFDVSAVAKQYGGGGHAQAAGFDVERLPWDQD